MIDLNSLLYSNEISKEAVLKEISQYQIFSYYVGSEFDIGTPFCSPLRNDNVPSFGVFNSKQYPGTLLFKDLATGQSGDCIVLVMKMYGLNYGKALWKIACDFGLVIGSNERERIKQLLPKDKKINTEKIRLGIKSRSWQIHDKKFWKSFGITKATLEKYNVVPISHIFFNGNPYKTEHHAYAFVEYKDGVTTYKIYQPYSKHNKWMNNHDFSIWQGWSQMPEFDNSLVITSSLKDTMSIVDVCNYNSVSLQAETTAPKVHIVEELKSRFKKIYILYDNDYDKEINWGRKYGKVLSEKFDLIQIEIPEKYKSKDFSDLVHNHGTTAAKSIFLEIINYDNKKR